ncbi:hypothetical protein AB0H18_19150 [Streptomyces sp. NPDC020766]|uniref:hypothetical protein n=1 Tax=Streptomyces sp. NPDC020766 TaxID=3155011 RepID=UPI0033E6A3B8
MVAPLEAGARAEDAGVSVFQPDARTTLFTYSPYELRVQAQQAAARYAAYLDPAPDPPPQAGSWTAGELVFPEPLPPPPQRTVRVAATHGVLVQRTPWSNLEDGSPELVVQQRWVPGDQFLDPLTETVIGPWVREVQQGDGAVQLELDESAIRISLPGSARGPATGSWTVHMAPRFAYWIEPEWTGAMRTERIVVVVASPGVRVEELKLDRSLAVQDYGRALVPQLVRVPHPALVPAQGTALDPNAFVGEQPVDEAPVGMLPLAGAQPSAVRAERGFAGNVTIWHGSGAMVSLAADPQELSSAYGAAFAWQVVTGLPTGDEIRIAAGPGTVVSVGEPIPADMTGYGAVSSVELRDVRAGRGLDDVRLSVRIVELPMADLVPLQGMPLNLDYLISLGGWYRGADHHQWLGTNDLPLELATTILDTGLSMIPVFGAFYLAGEFVYGLRYGRDFYGRELSELDLVFLGVGAVMELIPLVGPLVMRTVGAAVRAGEAAVRISAAAARVGLSEQRLEQLMWRLYRVSAVDEAEVVARVTQAISKGRDIPVKDVDRIGGLLRRLGANEEALARSRWGGFMRVAEEEGVTGAARMARAEIREWKAVLDTESRLRLRAEPALAEVYESMDPAVRRLLTWCGSACLLLGVKPTRRQVVRLRRVIETGGLIEGSLAERQARVYLHQAGNKLESFIQTLERQASSAKQLQSFLGRSVEAVDVVLLERSGLARTPAVRAHIRRALETGLDPVLLGEIMDAAAGSARSSGRLAGYLPKLGMLRKAGVPGVDVVLSDLARGNNWTRGAEWVMHYLETAPGGPLWGSVREFEAVLATGLGRREIDVLLKDGIRLQLKSWFEFRPRTFVEQIGKDWLLSGRRPVGFRWVFERTGLGDAGAIRAAAEQALRDSAVAERFGMNPSEIQLLIDALDEIIVVI